MPGPFHILSTVPISEQDLSEFTRALKGTVTSDITLNNVLSDGRKHVWFSLSNTSALEEVREKFKNGALAKLGTLPEACITVEISDEEGNSRWALNIAILILEKWVSVVDDFNGPMLTLLDLKDLERSGRPFLSSKHR